MTERAARQAADNDRLASYPVSKPGQKVLVDRPFQDTDRTNPKLLLPWRGPYIICSQLSPVLYRVRRTNETREVSVHLAHFKPFHSREKPSAPQLDKLANFFPGKEISLPALDHQDQIKPRLESYYVHRVVSHRCGPGRKGTHNNKY